MATVTQRGKKWRAQIRRLGFPPLSKTFDTKGRAWAWAEAAERDVLAGVAAPSKNTLSDGLLKYAAEVSPRHKGARWEIVRLRKLAASTMAKKRMAAVTTTDIAGWRDARLLEVQGTSVRREMGLLAQVFDLARREWRWITVDPMKDVDRPPEKKPRPRGVPAHLIAPIVAELGEAPQSRQVALAFLLGIETAMRPWELLGLEPYQVDFEQRVAHLDETKNGDERDVPLSSRAAEILLELSWMNGGPFFTVTPAVVTELFGRARDRLGIKNLHFRHSRGEGITRLSVHLDILELARAVGHRDLKSLLIYYAPNAAAMAKKLP